MYVAQEVTLRLLLLESFRGSILASVRKEEHVLGYTILKQRERVGDIGIAGGTPASRRRSLYSSIDTINTTLKYDAKL